MGINALLFPIPASLHYYQMDQLLERSKMQSLWLNSAATVLTGYALHKDHCQRQSPADVAFFLAASVTHQSSHVSGSNLCHGNANPGSLTCCTTRELCWCFLREGHQWGGDEAQDERLHEQLFIHNFKLTPQSHYFVQNPKKVCSFCYAPKQRERRKRARLR